LFSTILVALRGIPSCSNRSVCRARNESTASRASREHWLAAGGVFLHLCMLLHAHCLMGEKKKSYRSHGLFFSSWPSFFCKKKKEKIVFGFPDISSVWTNRSSLGLRFVAEAKPQVKPRPM
jgi:hypothetical protein